MPISVLGYSYEEYRRRRSAIRRMTTVVVEPLPDFVKLLALFACWMEVIMRFMYRFMLGFEIVTLKVPHHTVLLRNSYWDLTYGVLTVIVAWITDSHVGKQTVIFCGFTIVIIGTYLMALAFALTEVLGIQSMLLTVIYYMGKMLVFTAFAVNPVYIVFLLDQYEITHDVQFIEYMCVYLVIARNVGELLFGFCVFILQRNSHYPQIIMTVFAISLTFFLFSLFSMKSKLIHHHFKERAIESMFECFMTYGYHTENKLRGDRHKTLVVREASITPHSGGISFHIPSIDAVDVIERILTHEVVERITHIVNLATFLSPFIVYFFIVKMIYISWITEGPGLTPWDFTMSSCAIDMSISALSLITILAFEYIVNPLLFVKESHFKMAIKYFTVGHVLIGASLVTAAGIQILTHSQQSFVAVGTLKIHNALNVSSKIRSEFTGSLTLKPGATQYVRNIDVDDEYDVCRGIIYNSRLSWHLGLSFQTLVVKKNDVIIYVVTENGNLVRVDDFEPAVNFTGKRSKTQLLFINARTDSQEVELLFKGHTTRGKPVSHTIQMPKLTKQKTVFIDSGTYEVSSSFYKKSFKFNFKPKSYSHIISGDTIMKYDVDLPSRVDPILDLPAMTLYGMSTSIVHIYYLRFIFVQSPPPVRVFCATLFSFDIHIVNAILAVYWTYRRLNLFKNDYFIFAGCYLVDLVMFGAVIMTVTLNKSYVGTTVSR